MPEETRKKISETKIRQAIELEKLNLPEPDRKRCNRCRKYLLIEEFGVRRVRKRSGVRVYREPYCKACHREYKRELWSKHRNRINKRKRERHRERMKDPEYRERLRQYQREWCRMNTVLKGKKALGPRKRYAKEIKRIYVPIKRELVDWYFSFKEEKSRFFMIEYGEAWASHWASWLGFREQRDFQSFERVLRRSVDRKSISLESVERVLMAADCEHLVDEWWPELSGQS